MPSTHHKKRCPDCGGEAAYDVVVYRKTGEAKYYVFCRRCEAETGFYDTIDEAVAAWNKRTNKEEKDHA